MTRPFLLGSFVVLLAILAFSMGCGERTLTTQHSASVVDQLKSPDPEIRKKAMDEIESKL